MPNLVFKDETVKVEILGSVLVEDIRYAVFFAEDEREIYVYRYKKKKNKYILEEIKDQDEFNKVCKELDKKWKR